jgi:hypothetical protein
MIQEALNGHAQNRRRVQAYTSTTALGLHLLLNVTRPTSNHYKMGAVDTLLACVVYAHEYPLVWHSDALASTNFARGA